MVTQYPGHRLNGAILSMPDGIVIGMPFGIVTAMLNGRRAAVLFSVGICAHHVLSATHGATRSSGPP
jgi:hypothetical protein